MINSKTTTSSFIPAAMQASTVAKFWQRIVAAMFLLGAMWCARLDRTLSLHRARLVPDWKTISRCPESYPGRGTANMSVNLTYTSRVWRIGPITTILNNQWSKYQTITEAIYAENSVSGWRSSMDLPIIEWPRTDDTYYYTGKPFCHVCGSSSRQFRVARVYIILPDGSKHELRKGDQPYEGAIDMFGTFYAVDGSRLRYDSTGQSTGTLYFPDGTRYVLMAVLRNTSIATATRSTTTLLTGNGRTRSVV